MLRLLIVISSLSIGSFGVDVGFSFGSTCFSEDTSLELTAEYNGTGTVTAVQWYYSGQVSNNMLVLVGTCDTPGAVPAGFPDKSRMTFGCDLATNIFTLALSGLLAEELDKSWGATFSLSAGQSPDVEQKQIITCKNCKCVCDCECRTIVIVSMVFGILGALGLLIIVVGIPLGCLRETLLLTSGVIGIVFDVLSLVLSIVVKVKECCECCEENCEDSECCEEDSECCKDWIDNAAIAFIVIPCVAVVVSVVIFVLVKLDIIGPGSNGITKQDLRPLEETVCKKLLRVLESAYPKILLVKDLIRKVDAEETVVMEQLEELKRKDLIRQLDSGGFVRHFLDVKTGITKQDLRPLEEIVCEKLLRVLESVYPNILSVKDLIRIDFAEESVVMEQLEELRRKDLIKQLDSGGFVRHFLDVKTGH